MLNSQGMDFQIVSAVWHTDCHAADILLSSGAQDKLYRHKKGNAAYTGNDFSPEEYKNAKERYARMGFRVVTFKDGRSSLDIRDGIKAVIKNHIAGDVEL